MTSQVQTYQITKQVQAQPMTRLQYNDYRNWQLPSDEDGADEGYLIEDMNAPSNHPDHKGYISWMPKAIFDVVSHNITTPKDRVILEKQELKEKADKLQEFLKKGQPTFLTDAAWQINKEQWDAMMHYYSLLDDKLQLM